MSDSPQIIRPAVTVIRPLETGPNPEPAVVVIENTPLDVLPEPPVKIYYNTAVSRSVRRNNCGASSQGSMETYTVQANKYNSLISQADADAKAQSDLDLNTQKYANTMGTCTLTSAYESDAKLFTYYKNNCPVAGNKGSKVEINVPVGGWKNTTERTFTSWVSKIEANQKRDNYMLSNGQVLANETGSCQWNFPLLQVNIIPGPFDTPEFATSYSQRNANNETIAVLSEFLPTHDRTFYIFRTFTSNLFVTFNVANYKYKVAGLPYQDPEKWESGLHTFFTLESWYAWLAYNKDLSTVQSITITLDNL